MGKPVNSNRISGSQGPQKKVEQKMTKIKSVKDLGVVKEQKNSLEGLSIVGTSANNQKKK